MSKNTQIICALDKKYKRICSLGEGSYGTVHLFEVKPHVKKNYLENIFQNKSYDSDYVAVKIYKKPNTKN